MGPTPDPGAPSTLQLSTQQLEYLVAVARHPTWADAAASLGVSGSALSQGIAELERRLGVALFERDGRRRVPGRGHEVVLAYAQSILAATHDLSRWLDDRRRGNVGEVRLGLIDAAATHHCRLALLAFRDQRPDVDLRLTVAPSRDLVDRLERAELDLVVCVEPDGVPPSITTTALLDDPLSVLGPFGTSEQAAPGTWGPWVTFPGSSHTRAVVADAVTAAGATFDVVAESHQPEVLREMVRLGIGWAVLPLAGVDDLDGLCIVRRRLTQRRLALARRRDAAPHPATDALQAAIAGV